MKVKDVEKIVVHCSATREGDDTINAEVGRKLDECGAHTKGINCKSWGVCYVGGVEKDGKTPKDTRTQKQKEALEYLLYFLKLQQPDAVIHGHRDFANKACPSFDATEEYKDL